MNYGDSVEQIKKYFEKEKFTFTPVRQGKGEVSKAYGVQAYPTNYVISPAGKVSKRCVGFEEDGIKATLDKLLEKK